MRIQNGGPERGSDHQEIRVLRWKINKESDLYPSTLS